MHFYLFGYGSLIATPERADRVVQRRPATLVGHRRLFNKRSPGRGCLRRDAFDAFDLPPGFHRGDRIHSLAVGTEVADGAEIAGLALAYPRAAEAAVLRETDAREGYDAAAATAVLGYLRARVTLRGDGESFDAWTYLSNPGGAYHVDFDLETRAQILISATPRPGTPGAADGKARGIHYLEQLRDGLRRYDRVDPGLEAQAAHILALDGPWIGMVKPPSAV